MIREGISSKAMMVAVHSGHLPVVKYLAEDRAAAIDAKDANGRTALIVAKEHRQ